MRKDDARNNDTKLKDIAERLCTKQYDKDFINNKCLHELSQLLNENPDISENILENYGICTKLQEIKTLFVFNIDDGFFHPLILKYLHNVKNLTISSDGKYCQRLTRIEFLKSFNKLKRLTIHHAALYDKNILAPISNLRYLKSVDIQDCQINDISQLASIETLTKIRCNSNNIKEFPVMPYVKKLIAYNNPLRNIDSLAKAKNLEYICINKCNLNDISALGYPQNLHSIYCIDNQIEDISFIDNIRKLKTFVADNNQISSIDIVKKNYNLKTLSLRNNAIKDIENITNFPNITFLALDMNKISNIESIGSLESLKHLQLRHNNIKNIDCINNLANLQTLDIIDNPTSQPVDKSNFRKIKSINQYQDI